MTEVREQTFPFAGTEPLGTAELVDEPVAAAGRNKMVVIALVVVGALVLVAAAYFLFLKGGSSGSAASPVVPTHHAQPSAAAKAPAAAAKAPTTVTKSYDKAVGRDPFKALVVPPSTGNGSTTGTTTATTPGTTTSSTTQSTTSTGTTTTTVGGTSGPSSTGVGSSPVPVSLKLLTVADNNNAATLQVNSTKVTASVGAVFSTYFRVLALWNGKCGTFQYGDASFQLCEGQSVRMK